MLQLAHCLTSFLSKGVVGKLDISQGSTWVADSRTHSKTSITQTVGRGRHSGSRVGLAACH